MLFFAPETNIWQLTIVFKILPRCELVKHPSHAWLNLFQCFLTTPVKYGPHLDFAVDSELFAGKKYFVVGIVSSLSKVDGNNEPQYNNFIWRTVKTCILQVQFTARYHVKLPCPSVFCAWQLHVHSILCTVLKKNYIFIGYLTVCFRHFHQFKTVWYFLEVGGTKFIPDLGSNTKQS